MKKFAVALLASTSLCTTVMAADDAIQVGFVTTLTTGAAVIGNDMRDAVNLALDHMDNTMGGKPVEVLFEDDGFKPATGKQATDKLIKEDDVDIVAGYIWSHVLMASYRSVLKADKVIISANAGPSAIAGKLCDPNFFSTSWQNDQTPMALGELLNARGVKSLYLMAPNYAAGKDMVAGVERTFKGDIMGKDLTKWGADAQLDFSAELAKAKASGAEGIAVFYPGKAGGAFIKQYQQAGLADVMPLFTMFTVDALSLPKLQEANMTGILGSEMSMFWSPEMDNPANQKFVAGFREKYGRYPSFYAAQSYDAMNLIKSAADALDGDFSSTSAVRYELAKANFDSIRGDFEFGNNHMPIQNFYARKVVEDADGNWTTEITKTVFEKHQDTYAATCSM
ncbi:MAG: ABC transporter substrate-binding protein [Granulosicoccaceae bacterium]